MLFSFFQIRFVHTHRIHHRLSPECSQFDAEVGEYEICLSNDRRFEQVAKHVMLEVVEGASGAKCNSLKKEADVERLLRQSFFPNRSCWVDGVNVMFTNGTLFRSVVCCC